jgi:hypothetical protein
MKQFGTNMRGLKAATAILFSALLCPASFTQPEHGSICVAPNPEDMSQMWAANLPCRSNKFSLSIDDQKAFAWPTKASVKIDGLDIITRHRVVVYCDGKPHQSFSFRFSEYKARELCLFLNDLYKTVQLSDDPKQSPAPWCRCNSPR